MSYKENCFQANGIKYGVTCKKERPARADLSSINTEDKFNCCKQTRF
jgi:hypothetical protein